MVEEPFSRWPRKPFGVACKTGDPPPPLWRLVLKTPNGGGCEQPVNRIRRYRRFAAVFPFFSPQSRCHAALNRHCESGLCDGFQGILLE